MSRETGVAGLGLGAGVEPACGDGARARENKVAVHITCAVGSMVVGCKVDCSVVCLIRSEARSYRIEH